MELPLGWAERYLYPLLVALLLWGGLTAGLLGLNRRGPRAGRIALLALLPLLAMAHQQLWAARADLSLAGVYRSFVAGMIVWSWHELAFYSGVIAGPWRWPCPTGLSGWGRFHYALSTHLYHELAVGAEVALLWWIHRDAPNVFGPLTFVLLWALLHSAKLNVLLGVRSLPLDWLPPHLRYLGTFWTPRLSNPAFLPTVLSFSLLAALLWLGSWVLGPTPRAVGVALLAILATLGVLEHWLLALPVGGHKPAPRPSAIELDA